MSIRADFDPMELPWADIRNPRAVHAGNTQRRKTLFGEIGLPDRVANTS
jgi:hypothetical protein